MGLRQAFRRRSNDARWVVGALALLLVVFSGLFVFLLRSRGLEARLSENRVLLFALWYANVVLILALLFVLLRNLFKLLVERKHRILGSKLKTKLMATYIGLSLGPVVLMFFFAYQLLEGSIERWFNVPLQQVVQTAHTVAETYLRRIEADNLRAASQVMDDLLRLGTDDLARNSSEVNQRLQQQLETAGLDMISVYEGTDFLVAVVSPQTGIADLPEPEWNFLRRTMREGQATRVQALTGVEGRLMVAAQARQVDPERPQLIVVVASVLGTPLSNQLAELITAYQSHQQLVVQKEEIKASHLLLFLMATLLILFASSWVGLYLARRVTVPIQALAAGMRRIISGDLQHRVEVDADDELGVLVDAFNRMAAELERNRELLERGNRELVAINQRQAEERALIAAVLQNVPAGVVSLDRDGRVFSSNGAARAMLRQRKDIRGATAAEAWADPERGKLAALLEETPQERGTSRQLQMLLQGEWKTFEVTVTPMLDGDGRFNGQVIVLEDLTELIKAQKLAAWSEAARRIAHEIKNPLTPIKLSAERLLRKHRQGHEDLGQALEDSVAIIGREVDTMQSLVDEFSRFARMPQPQPTKLDLAKLLEETLRLYEGLKEGVEIRCRLEPEAREAVADPEQLKGALINLLDNALEATEAPGSVEVSAEQRDGVLQIHVADTGCGISPEDKKKLFLPYFSTKGRGTGLGLAIVHRTVSDHYGRIRVEDNKPSGTVFTLELPAPS